MLQRVNSLHGGMAPMAALDMAPWMPHQSHASSALYSTSA
jgi:hypothetical protein